MRKKREEEDEDLLGNIEEEFLGEEKGGFQEEAEEKLSGKSSRKGIIIFLSIFLFIMVIGGGTALAIFLLGRDSGGGEVSGNDSDGRSGIKIVTGDEGKENKKITRDKNAFSSKKAMEHIDALAGQIGSRPAGSVKESGAADYIVTTMGENDYTVEEYKFTTEEGFSSRDVIGTKRGSKQGYTILICAHYDSSKNTTGAVNNASGVAVVIELARLFKNIEMKPTLKFVFLGANQPDVTNMPERLTGARQFLQMMGGYDKKEIVGMISVDCVAQGEQLVFKTKEKGLQRLRAKMDTFAIEAEVPGTTMKALDDSDNIVFEDYNIPAVWICSADASGKCVFDDSVQGVSEERVKISGEFIKDFLMDLTTEDLEELKY